MTSTMLRSRIVGIVSGLIGVALFVTMFAILTGCMTLRVDAQSGSTINVTDSGNKRVTIETGREASVPMSALGL